MLGDNIQVMVAEECHEAYVDTILKTIEDAAKVRGTGIAKRTHEYLASKIKEAKAVIALDGDRFAGFSYIDLDLSSFKPDCVYMQDNWRTAVEELQKQNVSIGTKRLL